MRQGKSFRKKKNGASRLPKDKRQEIEKVAAEFGIKPARPGEDLDKRFTSTSPTKNDAPPKTLYQVLADAVGVDVLDRLESVMYVALGALLLAFLSTGLAIASEAFFKASQASIPPALDAFAVSAEKWFTPLLFVFIALSSILGIYKQSQLNSGAAQYDETNPPPS